MTNVTIAFAKAMARANGWSLTDEGTLLSDGTPIGLLHAEADGYIANSEYMDLIERVRAGHPNQARLVADYARSISPEALGVLGLAVKTAPDLRSSLKLIERYYRLITETAIYRLDEGSELSVFRIEGRCAPHPALGFRNECALAGVLSNLRKLLDGSLAVSQVSFRHAPAASPEEYKAVFGCDVVFGAEFDAITLPSSALDLSNRLGDAAVSDYMLAHLQESYGRLRREPPLLRDLLRRMTHLLQNGAPQASEIARDMGMSERTLYRRLAAEGRSYRDVLTEAQMTLAQSLLQGGDCSIAEIAFLTGFSEQSTFSRAFKRHVGQAPAQFRAAVTSPRKPALAAAPAGMAGTAKTLAGPAKTPQMNAC